MTDHCVPLANVARELFELGAVEVFPGGFVYKALVEGDALKLAQFFLVERADPEITDDLTGPALPFCHVWL